MPHINRYLLPFSTLYGAGVAVRGWLFDCGALKQHTYRQPVICVGNLTVGGTGKTPHTEYLVRQLKDMGRKVAVLSRGYGRTTHGYVAVTPNATADMVGDEPLQIARKHPDVTVAVCEKRATGLERLFAAVADSPDVVLLDDALQHRHVKAGLNIALVNYQRPVYDDALLPAGRLREPMSALTRAHIIIMSKCPQNMMPIDYRVVQQKLGLQPWQQLYFTRMEYGSPYPLFDESAKTISMVDLRTREHVMLLSGIAGPEQLQRDMASYCARITPLAYADHHRFTARDVKQINDTFASIAADDKLILTTEKDAMRLASLDGLSMAVRRAMYVLPIQVRFLRDGERAFMQAISEFVKQPSMP